MADEFTTRGRFVKQSIGARLNTWGLESGLNGNTDAMDEAVFGVETITVTGAVTLSTANLLTDQARNIGFYFVGSPSTAAAVTVPSVESRYAVYNTTGVSLTIKTAADAGVVVRTGQGAFLISTGTEVFDITSRSIDEMETAQGNASLNGYRINDLGTAVAGTDAVNFNQMSSAIASAGIPATSGAVLVSIDDSTSGYLSAKITAGTNVTVTELNGGANETLEVAVPTTAIGAAVLSPYADAEELIAVSYALST